MYVTDVSRWEEVGRAHGEVFGAAPPVSAMVGVAAFVDPRMLVEIEAVAFVPDPRASNNVQCGCHVRRYRRWGT